MKSRLLTTAALAAILASATAGAAAQGRQDIAALKRSVEQFLQVQTAGLPGQVTATVGASIRA
jgi:flagella basal body P-ring formation protein FlgA